MSALSTDVRLPSCVGERPASASSSEPVAPAGAGLSFSACCCACGVASCANQERRALARQQLPKNDRANLEQLFARFGRTSLRSIWRSGSAAANERHSSISLANASHRRARSSSSAMKCWIERIPCERTEGGGKWRRLDCCGPIEVLVGSRRADGADKVVGDSGCLKIAGHSRPERREPSIKFPLGGGLGIHEPGSITWGFAASRRRQSPSGRARNRAICPAVARSNLRGAA